MTLGVSDCLVSLKRSQTDNQCLLSVLQLPNNYEFKEVVIWQNNSVLVLLTSNKNMINDKPHSLLVLIDTSTLERIDFTPNGLYVDILEVLKNNSNVKKKILFSFLLNINSK